MKDHKILSVHRNAAAVHVYGNTIGYCYRDNTLKIKKEKKIPARDVTSLFLYLKSENVYSVAEFWIHK